MLVKKKSPEVIQATSIAFVDAMKVDYTEFLKIFVGIKKKINNLEGLLKKLKIPTSLLSQLDSKMNGLYKVEERILPSINLMLKIVNNKNFLSKQFILEEPNYREILFKFSQFFNVAVVSSIEKKDDSELKIVVLLIKEIQKDLEILYKINDKANHKFNEFEILLYQNKIQRYFIRDFSKLVAVINGSKNDVISATNSLLIVLKRQRVRPTSGKISTKKPVLTPREIETERTRIIKKLTERISLFASFALSSIDDRIKEMKMNSHNDFKAITKAQQKRMYATSLAIYSDIGKVQNTIKRVKADYDTNYLIFDEPLMTSLTSFLTTRSNLPSSKGIKTLRTHKKKILEVLRNSNIKSRKEIEDYLIDRMDRKY